MSAGARARGWLHADDAEEAPLTFNGVDRISFPIRLKVATSGPPVSRRAKNR
jgi:hypothetical protein